MYDQFYGLKARPFQLTPDPHFYFESATHRKAMSYLGYGLAQGEGFIVITGEIGAGKTTLVAHLMNMIDPQRLTAVKMVSTQVDADDLLRLVAQGFGIPTEGAAKAQLLQRVEAWLHSQARAGRRTLLVVDEAQNLSIEGLEELRMLSNFQLGGQSLLQIFLLGQPEFREMVNHAPELEQVRQRVIATHHLEPMAAEEVEPYVTHRLTLVGWTGNPLFSEDAFTAIHAASGGIPRRINAIASRAMLLGAIDELDVIDAGVVDAVVADMASDVESPAPADARASEPKAYEGDEADAASDAFDDASGASERFEALAQFDARLRADTHVDAVKSDQREKSGFFLHELHAIRAEVEEIRRAMDQDRALWPQVVEKLEDLDQRMQLAETRADEQEAALRRVLTLLIDWVEHDEPAPQALRQGQGA